MKQLNAVGANIFAGGFTLGVSKHFHVLAHLEHDDYGVEVARANFKQLPVFVGKETWPEKANKPIHFLYANPPCFDWSTRVFTEGGPRMIGELVRSRSKVNVLSVDKSGKHIFKPIVGWHENPYRGDLYRIQLRHWNTHCQARATGEHQFLTRRGWVSAAKLRTTDEVCTGYVEPNQRQRELITGMLLGDATIKKHQAQFVVAQISHDYVEIKRDALKPFVCKSWRETIRHTDDGYVHRPRSWFYLKTEGWAKKERQRWYHEDGSRKIPRDIDLTPLTLAVWYMDDGTRRSQNTAMLCSDRFSSDDIEFLIGKLNSLGIEAWKAWGTGGYERIWISAKGFPVLVKMIARYVIDEMRYKLPDDAPAFDPTAWEDFGEPQVAWDYVNVENLGPSDSKHVYCIDVKDTHNFATYGGIAHNCAIWSLAGNAVDRRDWRLDPRLQRVRDIFALVERYRPQVWAWESVCQAFEKGRPFVEELASEAAKLGYSASYVLVDAQYLRAPQTRKRFFLVLHRVAIDWAKAVPDFTALPVLPRDALRGVVNEPHLMPPNKSKYIEKDLFKLVKPGQRFRAAFDKLKGAASDKDRPRNAQGKVIGRPGFLKIRLDPDRQVGVVFGDSTFHHKEDRLLSMNELSALHGFPPSFKWLTHRDGKTMIPRGVLPPVGEWLARHVAAAIRANRPLRKLTRTLVDFRHPPGLIQGILALPGSVDLSWRPERPAKPARSLPQSHSEPLSRPATPRNTPEKKVNKIKDLAKPARMPGKSAIRIKDLGDIRGSSRALLVGLARGVRPGTSGELIRARLLEGKLADDAMAAEVRKLWPGRTTSKADVTWNRSQLRKAGAL